MDTPERCMAPTGTVWTGPLYCGNKAKGHDRNGRPVCGVHRRHPTRTEGTAWFGDRGRYPEGTQGDWKFSRGEFR